MFSARYERKSKKNNGLMIKIKLYRYPAVSGMTITDECKCLPGIRGTCVYGKRGKARFGYSPRQYPPWK